MTEAGFFNFTPEEYQVLEDIEFDETLQRDEKVRFYTLEEQTSDAFEKMVPKGKTTRFQRDQLKKEVDRIRELYEKYVMALPEDYTLREPEYAKRFDWISPVYASGGYTSYGWKRSLMPLYDNVRQPNFYPALLAALPRPHEDSAEGAPYPLTESTRMVDDTGTRPSVALPDYKVPHTQIHEDKTIDILLVPAPGTADIVNFTGYYLQKRALPIPNPLESHPFLKSNDATYIPSTAPLSDVVPSLDAILTHGVPVTRDPYGEAMPFLKIYDVKLSDIPWSTWKSKFPPVDVENNKEAPPPIEFPKPAQLSPPEKITEAYSVSYEPGVSVRKWLMERVDGGGLVVDLLRSMVIDNGSVEAAPGIDLEQAEYPTTTMEECSLADKNFPDFNVTGILRRTWKIEKDKTGKEFDNIKLKCVPLEFVRQERARTGYLDRKPWKETTGDDIKKAYLRRLAEMTPIKWVPKETRIERVAVKSESLRRVEALVIQNDPARYPEDKYRDIQALLREVPLTQNVYKDSDGAFVYCAHALALLGGDLALDRRAYYDKWCAKIDGKRVCRFCGEVVNDDVIIDQDEFDDEGFMIRHREVLDQQGFHGAAIQSFTTGLTKLRPLFMLDNAHDETVMLVLSIIQVLPDREHLEPLLKNGRMVAAVQFNKGSADQIAKFTGMMGLATTALILQTHVPTLVPRRSFGPRPLKLTGYPRDSAEPEEITIVDTLIGVMRKTFESFPTSFKGEARQLIRAILTSSGEVKRTVTMLLSAKSPLMKLPGVTELLGKAKSYHAGLPPVEAPKTLIPVLPPPKEMGVINSFVECPSARPIWTSGRPPKIVQGSVALWPNIYPSERSTTVEPAESTRVDVAPVPVAEIRTRRSKGTGLKTRVRVGTSYRANMIMASRLADVLQQPIPVREVDVSMSADALRDVAQGFVYEELAGAQASAEKRNLLEKLRTTDACMYILQANYADEKREVNKLRATEHQQIVSILAKKSDGEREVIGALMKVGLSPFIFSSQDRLLFADTARRLRDVTIEEDEEADVDRLLAETGVGVARDAHDDGEENENVGVDHGDYGDRAPLPVGRDYQQPGFGDDPRRST